MKKTIMVKIQPDEISSIIRQQIEQYNQEVKIVNVGTVFQVGDGIARIYGLEKVMAGELLEFDDNTVGIALNLETKNVGAVLMGEGLTVQEGSSVRATGKIAQISVGDEYLGRVVNSLARPIDGKGEINTSETRLIESPAPGIISRKSVHEPLQTGIVAVDAMIPIGRGQVGPLNFLKQTFQHNIIKKFYYVILSLKLNMFNAGNYMLESQDQRKST
eukprot:TRINITY_DN9913_c0_g2_i1.p2 TRINITY_DN9913_c0_g2~~TRINITY_DN9913_c0_g2_i1.p2  ORF type:complete len:217 (+),score=31.73 TRINITY_DN9913_c0_g2_i1:1662-2312(+)